MQLVDKYPVENRPSQMRYHHGLLGKLLPFLRWSPRVDRQTTRDDLLAGFTGALIVLPQGVAFATIAGLPPQYGIYAAMMPAVIAALWGSSWHLVSGPTTAISIAVFAALAHQAEPGSAEYISLVLTLTFLVGVFELTLGIARMGALVNFISHTVVIGFTAGAAMLIAASQVRNFFGIAVPRGAPFHEIVYQLGAQAGDINVYVTLVGLITLVTGILSRRYLPRVPYMIVAMIVGSAVAATFNAAASVETTGIKTVGALPAQLPPLSMPDLSLESLRRTLGPALVIAMLALTEAVSIARAIAVRSEQRIDGNQEFIGQGLSNIVGSFFSAYASSGSFNRSGVNYEAGARTPLASVYASGFLLLVLLLVAPLAAYLPTAAMAGILFLVAWGLIDFPHIAHIWRTSKTESAILATTLVGTLANLEAGIFVGVFLSLVVYLYRTSRPEIIPVVPAPEAGAYHFVRAKGRPECPQVRIVRINGSVYFGAASYVQQALMQIDEDNPLQKTVLIAAASINAIDVAGAEVLAQEARRRRRLGGGLYFYRLNDTAYGFLRKGDYVKHIGEGAFFPVMTDVTRALYGTLDPDVCRTCKTRIFKECNGGVLPDGLRRQRLMLAIDGNESSNIPTAIAAGLAQRFGVTLDIMTAVESAEYTETARQRLAKAARNAHASGVATEEIVRYGRNSAQEIVAAAVGEDTGILVIGRHRAMESKPASLGDTVARVLADAPCHVLVAGSGSQMWKKRILFACDPAQQSDMPAEFASQIARITRTPITLVSAVSHDRERDAVLADLARRAAQIRIDGVECDTLVVQGSAPDVVARTALKIDADLVVVGDPRKGLAHILAGGVLNRVLGLQCAVLVLKAESIQAGTFSIASA